MIIEVLFRKMKVEGPQLIGSIFHNIHEFLRLKEAISDFKTI